MSQNIMKMIASFELLLHFYVKRSLQRINDCQLNIKYAMGVCYCCFIKNTSPSKIYFHETKGKLGVSLVA